LGLNALLLALLEHLLALAHQSASVRHGLRA
jgi:hypothetical protein